MLKPLQSINPLSYGGVLWNTIVGSSQLVEGSKGEEGRPHVGPHFLKITVFKLPMLVIKCHVPQSLCRGFNFAIILFIFPVYLESICSYRLVFFF